MAIGKKLLLCLTFFLLLAGLLAGGLWVSVSEEEVEFQNDGLLLRGTLLSPRWGDAAPGVVLVHGSGEVTRKSMLAYAWLFAIKGYAAVAYDKRGLGASEGQPHEWRDFNFVDLAGDAAAAYGFLQSQPGIDSGRVGFFGASQGGWVVSLAANQVDAPAFAIMVSASLATVAEDRVFGRRAQVRHAGFDEGAVSEASRLILADHAVTRSSSSSDYANFIELWNSLKSRPWFVEVYGDARPEPADSAHRQWEKTVLDFDPMSFLKLIDAPVLWIFGDPSLDRFSPVSLSMDRVSEAQDSGACYQIIQIDGVGHTLEADRGDGFVSFLRMRISLILDIYDWLDNLGSPESCRG
jgi:pimeloyl-ACP methyl ester carboxylesterase